jgi:hypothetical protein
VTEAPLLVVEAGVLAGLMVVGAGVVVVPLLVVVAGVVAGAVDAFTVVEDGALAQLKMADDCVVEALVVVLGVDAPAVLDPFQTHPQTFVLITLHSASTGTTHLPLSV